MQEHGIVVESPRENLSLVLPVIFLATWCIELEAVPLNFYLIDNTQLDCGTPIMGSCYWNLSLKTAGDLTEGSE